MDISWNLCWSLLVLADLVCGSTAYGVSGSELPPARVLSPATLTSRLKARDLSSSLLKRETTFDFLEGGSSAPARLDGSVFTASLLVRSQQPILALEDIEPDLQRVACSESEIELFFTSIAALERVQKEIENLSDFVAVSSHFNCNAEDERAPHRITNAVVHPERKSIILSKSSCEWKDAFDMIEVSFSRKPMSQVVRRSVNVKRQEGEDPFPTPTETPAGPTRSFPSVTDTASASPTATAEINVDLIDQVVFPPEIPGASLFIPDGVTLTCKNCTVGGAIELSQGSFRLEDPTPDNPVEFVTNAIDFFKYGTVQVDVEDLFAHIELGTKLDLAANALNFSVPLPAIPITPFMIPGIVAFGPIFNPQIEMSLTLKQAFEFEYGFDMVVPNNSSFTIDIGTPGNSTMVGFTDTKFTALPFQAEGTTGLEFSIAFTPEILLGVTSTATAVTGGIGAFFNIPSITVKVEQLDNVNGNCDPLPTSSPSASPKGDDDGDNRIPTLDDLVGNFTNIVPTVELNLGAIAEVEFGLGKANKNLEAAHTILSKEFALPTACLAFNEKEKSFASPTPPPPPPPPAATTAAAGEKGAKGSAKQGSGAMRAFGIGGVGGERGMLLWACVVGALLGVTVGL
ncbi:hypothetical protein FQN55_003862 [Onygenales sp. PD_40]|nr:hypothetical protein FQN55_003862 [Onygenales sp. PD_40]KAK2791081.1 hypothetical protein FQN52_005035 [Onygenales sp. PD_12]